MTAKLLSIFIKHHPAEADFADLIERILKECGNVVAWKPQKNPINQQYKNFGFADFDDMEVFSRAVRIMSVLSLPDADSGTMKPIIVRVDNKTTELLNIYNQSAIVDLGQDDVVKTRIDSLLKQHFHNSDLVFFSSNADTTAINKESKISGDLKSVPLQETDKLESDDKVSDNGQVNSENGLADNHRKVAYEQRRKAEIDRLFHERLNDWRGREQHRADTQVQILSDKDTFKENAEKLSKYLSEYDDDLEEGKVEDLWFADRDMWIRNRRPHRTHEEQMDSRDRYEEQRELSMKSYEKEQRISDSDKMADVISPEQLKEELDKLRMRLSLIFSKDDSKPEGAMQFEKLFNYPIDWNLLTAKSIEVALKPLVEARVCKFLGHNEPELVEFINDTILPVAEKTTETAIVKGKDPYQVLDDVTVAFGDSAEEQAEALALVTEFWQTAVWEVEKIKLFSNRKHTENALESITFDG